MSERRKQRKQKLLALLGGKCVRCGTTENLQFDHIDPKTKKFRIGHKLDVNEAVLEREALKCQLLCDSCHKQKTKENHEYNNIPPAQHGTIWMYGKYKCRCDACKKAMSDYYFNRKSKLNA